MKRYKVGDVYAARLFDNGQEIKGRGFYHFKIIELVFDRFDKVKIAIGIKLNMYGDYADAGSHTVGFSLSGDGIIAENLIFTITRKLKAKQNTKLYC
jgi:hypothetical protein